jgi:hypothetical protein
MIRRPTTVSSRRRRQACGTRIPSKLDLRDISPTRRQDRRSACWLRIRLILCAVDSLRHCGLTTGRTGRTEGRERVQITPFLHPFPRTRPFISNYQS